jgi:5,5'-dehydrodivanillate O-demethylase oxygenase subunit
VVLAAEENQLLTQKPAGTPMDELLRRYGWPIAAVNQLTTTRTKAVRLLGEDLVLYRDLNGIYGLLECHCPQRRAEYTQAMGVT